MEERKKGSAVGSGGGSLVNEQKKEYPIQEITRPTKAHEKPSIAFIIITLYSQPAGQKIQ